MTDEIFRKRYFSELCDEGIIFCLSSRRNISFDEAMQIYYSSKLSDRVYDGVFGESSDYSSMTDMLEDELKAEVKKL